MINVEAINKLMREREELLRNIRDIDAIYDERISEVADMLKYGKCTKEQYFAYKTHMDESISKLKTPIQQQLAKNMEEIRKNAMVTPLELAKLVEIGLFRNHRYDQLFRGFMPNAKYKLGDSYHTSAGFDGFYEMWEKEGTAMAFVKNEFSRRVKLSINDKEALILHTTDIPMKRSSDEAQRDLLYGKKVCLFESEDSARIGKEKPEDIFIPFRLSSTGRADAYHSSPFTDAIANGICEYLGIEPVRITSQGPRTTGGKNDSFVK